jgi:hypothetical protein
MAAATAMRCFLRAALRCRVSAEASRECQCQVLARSATGQHEGRAARKRAAHECTRGARAAVRRAILRGNVLHCVATCCTEVKGLARRLAIQAPAGCAIPTARPARSRTHPPSTTASQRTARRYGPSHARAMPHKAPCAHMSSHGATSHVSCRITSRRSAGAAHSPRPQPVVRGS